MKKIRLITLIFSLSFIYNSIQAQQWHHYNPTAWFDINSVEIPGPGIIVIGGGQETNDSVQVIFQSTDYGLTWHENPHDSYAPWNKSIAFSDSLNGLGVGYNGRIIRSEDAGMTWGWPVTPVNRDLNKIVYAGSGYYFIAGGNRAHDSVQTILKSKDFGNSWNVIHDSFGPWLKSIIFTDTSRGCAVGDNGVILTTANGGYSWSAVTSPLQRDFNAIAFINADTGYIVGGTQSVPCRRTILRTVNGGITWNIIADTTGGMLKDISFADGQVGYAVGDSATILKTTDGGLNWIPVIIDSGLVGNEAFNAVKFRGQEFGAIAGKSGVLYVYKNLPVEMYNFGTIHAGTAEATLYGGINTHTKSARYSFVYSDNVNFVTSYTTQSVNVRNDSLLFISETIQGLNPNTAYYYFIKAITSTDTVYSDTLRFYTLMNYSVVFQTLDATSVSSGSADLNGFINKFPIPVNVYFEYGTNRTFGSQISASPSTVNDTLMHTISADMNSLISNKRYFFRLKGETGWGTYYGDTKEFFTADLPPAYTGNANIISSTSARLNGNVMINGTPTALRFEYGPSILYGTEVSAVPDTSTGMGIVEASCTLNSLSPSVTYHFRIKAICPAGISYGRDMTFITGGPIVSTSMVSDFGINSAELEGTVNANGYTTVNTFEFGLTTDYGHEATATPASSSGNSDVNIHCPITGLMPDTLYHFRVKAINTIGTAYGNDITFTTATPPSVSTSSATEITLFSATLNGKIDAGGIPTSVTFEYGTTTAYGNVTAAIPDSVSGIGIIDVHSFLSGLTPGTIYHFRIKGVNSLTTKSGEDMIFYTGYPEIPNFDFEEWTPILFPKPSDWDISVGKITQYVPACHGNLAVKLENAPPEQPGVILIGNSPDMGQTFSGGTPFNARPDSMAGCFNYSIPGNDTALIALVLKNQGVIISRNWYKIYGNSSGDYVELKFPIHYIASGNADSLIIAFVVTDILHQTQLITGGYLIADHIRFTGTTENFPNNDFENWDTTIYYSLDKWWYAHKYEPSTDHPHDFAIQPTTDAQHGNYALLVQTFSYPSETMLGTVTTSESPLTPGFSVTSRHRSLTGYYKFFPENNDTLFIQADMFKNHNKIGSGNFLSTTPVQNYIPFIARIYYQDSVVVPDSAQIYISSGNKGHSMLYIDHLNFDGFFSGINESLPPATDNINFNVYPNPFNEMSTLEFTIHQSENVMLCLLDLSGKQVAVLANKKFDAGDHKILLSAERLQKGFYICVLNTEERILSKKLIIY